MKNDERLTVIGHSEYIDIPIIRAKNVLAKIDTGADSSSIWASKIIKNDKDELLVSFFDKSSKFYTGVPVKFTKSNYSRVIIKNSFGDAEIRYRIKLIVKVKNRTIRATFTLANRQSKTYPILIGKRLLRNKFLVDVSESNKLSKPSLENEN